MCVISKLFEKQFYFVNRYLNIILPLLNLYCVRKMLLQNLLPFSSIIVRLTCTLVFRNSLLSICEYLYLEVLTGFAIYFLLLLI